ncbi:MAG: TspO/MBR family protein [Stenomitos frigidus ULC029]
MIKSWMVIGGVALLIAFASGILRPKDVKWFARLQRPRWLTFEALIPVIWTVVLVCGAWSAYIIWEREPGNTKTWMLMSAYALLEIAIVLYSPVLLWLRSLKAGTIVGGIGVFIGVILTLIVWQISGWAALLLVPFLLWSPIGTYTTWEMGKLNPESV